MIRGLMTDPETTAKDKEQLAKCLDSLAKYPLVIKSLEQCTLLRHFSARILALLKGENQVFPDHLSPISKPSSSSLVIDLTAEDSDDILDQSDPQKDADEKRREQEEADYQLALRLSQNEEDLTVENVPQNQYSPLPKHNAFGTPINQRKTSSKLSFKSVFDKVLDYSLFFEFVATILQLVVNCLLIGCFNCQPIRIKYGFLDS